MSPGRAAQPADLYTKALSIVCVSLRVLYVRERDRERDREREGGGRWLSKVKSGNCSYSVRQYERTERQTHKQTDKQKESPCVILIQTSEDPVLGRDGTLT